MFVRRWLAGEGDLLVRALLLGLAFIVGCAAA